MFNTTIPKVVYTMEPTSGADIIEVVKVALNRESSKIKEEKDLLLYLKGNFTDLSKENKEMLEQISKIDASIYVVAEGNLSLENALGLDPQDEAVTFALTERLILFLKRIYKVSQMNEALREEEALRRLAALWRDLEQAEKIKIIPSCGVETYIELLLKGN